MGSCATELATHPGHAALNLVFVEALQTSAPLRTVVSQHTALAAVEPIMPGEPAYAAQPRHFVGKREIRISGSMAESR
jgi:hypothetical protein